MNSTSSSLKTLMKTLQAETSHGAPNGSHKWVSIAEWSSFAILLIAGVAMLIATCIRLVNEPGDYVSKSTMMLFVGAVACLFGASLTRPNLPKTQT
jgi:hypothetical protein